MVKSPKSWIPKDQNAEFELTMQLKRSRLLLLSPSILNLIIFETYGKVKNEYGEPVYLMYYIMTDWNYNKF